MNKVKTTHKIILEAAHSMSQLKKDSIALVVTSPPYPMIEMWDEIMSNQNLKIRTALDENNGKTAFELMHKELDKVWNEVNRVLVPGGYACINIGDATRKIGAEFALYSNHSRIISAFLELELSCLPSIIWRKQTNAPNKFMGSGMLPAGAYVTLEHEWILIFRKGGKQIFDSSEDKLRRQKSSFFWEERNVWFSDLWELKGTKQKIKTSETRKRSAAYPFELPYRLINMYSLKGDTVLDPFLGTGTTTIAAIASQRNSIGYEIDPIFSEIIANNIEETSVNFINTRINSRIEHHKLFIQNRELDITKKEIKHFNKNINMPVITKQESNLEFSFVKEIKNEEEMIVAYYDVIRPSQIDFPIKNKSNLSQQSLF